MDEKEEKETKIANETWRQGFVHLTVDGYGLVSLWDGDTNNLHGNVQLSSLDSYLKLPLTKEQIDMIQATMNKGGYTP